MGADERRTGDTAASGASGDGLEALPPDLRAVAARYARQPTPRPTAAATERLLAALLAAEPAARAQADVSGRARVRGALRVAAWRVRLLGAPCWCASALALALAPALADPLRAAGLAPWHALVLLGPLTAVLGLAHALRTPHAGLRAVEAACPLGAGEALGGLVLAVVAFDCAFGLAVTLALALAGAAPFLALAATWLAPLLLLAGLTLPVALRRGAAAAALVGGAPWLALIAAARLRPTGPFALPEDTAALLARLAVAGLGALLLLLALRTAPARPRAGRAGP